MSTVVWRIVVYCAVLALAVPALRGREQLAWGSELAAATVAGLHLLAVPAARSGEVVSNSAFSMRIIPVCDGTDVSAMLALAILVSPASWGARLLGVAVGVVLTQLFNLGRLVSMFVVGAYYPQHFDLFHHLVWQGAAVVFAVAAYAAWFRWVEVRA
jgi:exosortase/archaeosortase family protein